MWSGLLGEAVRAQVVAEALAQQARAPQAQLGAAAANVDVQQLAGQRPLRADRGEGQLRLALTADHFDLDAGLGPRQSPELGAVARAAQGGGAHRADLLDAEVGAALGVVGEEVERAAHDLGVELAGGADALAQADDVGAVEHDLLAAIVALLQDEQEERVGANIEASGARRSHSDTPRRQDSTLRALNGVVEPTMSLDRRTFLAGAAVTSASLAAANRAARAAAVPARRPNILLIMSDDMGFSDLGCYGGEIRTPNLDRLAAGGLRYSQFYNTARCCPTRASLLTGLYPHQAGVGHMTDNRGLYGYRGQLKENTTTIAEALRGAGYSTYMVGKWHVSRQVHQGGDDRAWPMQRGFERYYGTLTGAGTYYDPGTLCRDHEHISPLTDPHYQPDEPYYYTTALGDNGARFIEQHAAHHPDQPFFFYAAFTAAHWPLHAPEEAIAAYRGRYDDGYEPIRAARLRRVRELGLIDSEMDPAPLVGEWDRVQHKAWEARCMEVYAAQVELLDAAVGRLVAALEASGQLDDTLILFLQDNGACAESIGRDGQATRGDAPTLEPMADDAIRLDVRPTRTRDGWPVLGGPDIMPGPDDTYISYGRNWANVSNTPLREYKHWVHEGGISTPLIAHWPRGLARAGEIEHQPGHLIDIWATCVDLAGAPIPTHRAGLPIPAPEGRSLAPTFTGGEIDREALFWEHEGNRALRVGRWKLVARGPGRRWELYDLPADRGEQHDLALDQPERVAAMAATWERWAQRTHALPWPWRPAWGEPVASSARRFDLRGGDSLNDGEAPDIVQREIVATVEFTHAGGSSGVLVAHGGNQLGYALYVRGGHLEGAVRMTGEQIWATDPAPLAAGAHTAVLRWVRPGRVTVELDGREVARTEVGGLLEEQPVDGLDVGRDTGGAVGRYNAPAAYGGSVERAVIELGD